MRKSFTRLFSVVMLLCMISLGSIAQARWHNYQLEPDDGTCTVAKTGTFTITFDQDVIPVKGGKISLNAADGTQIYPIQFNWTGTAPTLPMVYTSSIAPYGTVTFDGKKVIVDFKATLKELTNYYISVSPGAIKDASGTLFGGILGTAPGSGALTCSNDLNYGWDFTVGDFTAPTVAELTPKDEAKDVAGDQVLSIKFNESMVFAPGKSFASLVDGDIALYTSTDPILGQYGGDVIYTKPASITGTGTNTISIKWPGNMPSLTNVYVRIKAGIFAEYQECPSGVKQVAPKVWGGFNSNGQDPMLGDNGAWNFTTKDTRAPKVVIARDNCNNNSNFTISIDEGNIVTAAGMVALTNANVKQFVTFTGGDFDATVSGATLITVNPKNDLASGATVTVGLKTGLWDSSHNGVPATEKSFTNGDYLAPVITASAVNPVGTSFDLLAQSNEASTVYYVVVKKSDVQKDGADFYKPTAKQVFDLANTYDGKGNSHIPTVGLYDDELAGNQLATYFFDHATNANDKTVNIWAAGKFDINTANTNVLERVLDLPRTNGTDYVVYAYAIDDSECGVYNHSLADNGWITPELRYAVKTSDVLPAVPSFTADVNTKQFCETGINRILRNGAIKVTFNEPIRLADGSPITSASLEDIFYVENAGKQIGINTVTSSIDAAKKVITIYPDSAFKSGSTVYIKLLSNKIEDEAGVERNITADKSFCVENYCEPLIKWTADVVRPEAKDNAPIINGAVEVAKDATIQVVFDQLVYAPADNEYPKGVLTQLSNNSSDLFWAGRYIKVREAASLAGAPTGTLIYANGNEDNFNVTVNAYSEGKTILTITPKGGYVFGSEMFYNVEVEGQLQNAERYSLISGICNKQANNITFQVTDHLAPVVSFFEANGEAKIQDLNKCVNCDTPTLDVKYDNRIGVKISEWVELGFDGFRDLQNTETIKDANALRRYFSLTKCDGTAIKFDVKDFSLDKEADVATMYIDPYDYPTVGAEKPNFVKGEGYTVKFISNPNELPETGTYYPGAFEDDHGNLVNEGQSCFKVYKEPVYISCFDKITVGTEGCQGVKADLATLSVKLQFKQPMFALATSPISYLSVWAKSAGNDHLVGYIPTNKMVTTDGGLTYTAKPTSIDWVHYNDSYLVDQTEYYIAFSNAAVASNFACFSSVDQTSGNACSWPTAADYKTVNWIGADRAVVDTFKTGDATAPVLNTWTTGTIAKTADLVMTFSEKIIPVAGQVVKVYENGTNTLVATINVNGLNADKDNVLTIPNSLFNTFLSYSKTYYAQFNPGLVTDECGNPTTSAITNKTDWTFTIESDPAPAFVCNSFAPTGTPDVMNLTPSFVVKFSEPVVPVAGKVIDIYESLPNNATANLGNFNVTSMVANADKTQYTITYSAITALKPQLTYGNCYHMNIQAGAFKEAAGAQTTAALVSFVTTNAPVLTACTWDFCIKDVIAPKVTFWPADKKENIPLNAYLFAYISEPVQFQEGYAFTEVNAKNSFKLEKQLPDLTWKLVDFKVEAVGTNFDKQRVMITPLDPDAPDFGATTNPTMDDDSWYRLSVINPNTGGYHLQDAAGNALLAGSVVFHTEDITCPTNAPVVTSAINGSGFTFEVQLDEKGTVDYRVVKKGAANTAENAKASGSAVTNASGYVKFVVSGIDANTASGYDYDLYITKTDDETDRLDTDAEIMAEWPYTMNPSWNLETIRIKDLRPAPNKCESILAKTVTLCDNDAPFVIAYSPSLATPKTDFVVTDNITFTLNETVQFTAAQPAITPNQIALRDYENNLVVDAAITLATDKDGKYVVTIDPKNPLADQHRYYVTWDRYAISDLAGCAGVNYLAERTDKTWWFKTKDNTAPVVLCESLLPVGNCVDKNADLVVTVQDGNMVDVNPAVSFIEIYEVNDAVPHERIPVTSAIRKDNGNGTYTFTFPTAYFYLSDKCYTAVLPAGLFKDQAGNTSVKPSCQWHFCAKDYEAPIASWKVNQDFSYMYVATTDPQYDRVIESGDAGETLDNVPTSSYVTVQFNENIMVLDTIGKDAWRYLPVSELTTAEIGNALSVSNGTKALVYGKDFRVEKLGAFGNAQNRFAVVITDDFSHLGYSGSDLNYNKGSMASNATYHVGLKKGFISDPMDVECESHNIIEEDVNLLTIITRDDTPPTLTMKDANGALLCGASCADANNSYLLNALQPNEFGWLNFSPVWPVQGKDSLCNVCVAPGDHITLEFNKPVVKTPTDLINVNPFWWENGGVDWWTTANLGLKSEDFINPATSKYIKFQKRVGKTWVNVDALDHVTVTNNQTIQLFWKGNLESEGIYAITFAPYTVKDQVRVPDGNEFLGQTCVFQVKDHQKPLVAKFEVSQNTNSCNAGNSTYPVDVNTDAQLSILFNEGVQPGLAGKKLIIRRENGQQQQIIDASTITVDPKNGKRILVNNADFEENTLYYVEIQSGFVTDTAVCGINEYAGIDPEDSAPGWQAQIPNFAWVFKTGDNTPPEPIVLTPNRQSDVSRQSDLTMIFDENVYTSCICASEPPMLSSPMTWNDYTLGKGFYIYADNGVKPSADFGNFVEFIPWNSPRIIISGSDIYNGKTSDKVIINPATEFEKNMVYYIRVSKGIFCDGYKNTWDGIGDSTTWKFTITNDVAPEISSTTPNFKAAVPETLAAENNGYVVADLSMSFVDSEQKKPLMVKAGVGSIKIFEYIYNPITLSYEEKLWKEISINDPSVEFVGNTVTIKDVKLRDDVNPESCNGPRMYYVTVNSGAITNGYPGSLTFWEGFNDAFDWRFYTGADNTFVMPVEIVSPVETNLSVEDASKLEIKFAENIEAIPGTNAKVKIFNAKNDALVDQFTVVPANIFGGNTLKLTTNKLVDETKYYVLIENGAFGDTSSCSTPFPGIMDKEEWTFATGDNTAPVPVWAADLDNCEDTCVTLTFNFKETNGVTAGAGKVILLVDGKVFASAPAVVGDNVNEITAKFCNLPDTTVFTISLDAAVVIDNGNKKMANVQVADPAWTFATGDNTNPRIVSLEPVIANAESTVTLTVKASEVVTPVAGKKIIISSVAPAKSFDVATMVTKDGGLTYTLVVDGLADMTDYEVKLEAGAFKDMACQANVSNESTWSFTTDDNTAPQIVTVTPEDGDILPSYVGMNLAFTFDEKVTKGTGKITITRGTNVLEIPVSSSTVVVDGEKVSVDLDDMLYFGKVTVSVPQGAFVDLANQPNSSVAKSWTFTIFDETAPNCVTIINPTDGQTGLGTAFALEMSFCERMVAGNQTKKLKVYEVLEVQGELGGNKLFYSTPITANMINGKLVTVPLTGLSDNTSYTVMIDADALRDEAGNSFEGITDPIQWNFTTGDNTAPTVVSVTPAASSNTKNSFDVTIKFSEEVTGVASAITVSKGEVAVSGSGDTYVATITGNDGDVITMTIGTTVVDASMNNLAAAVTKTYTIGDNTAPTVVVTDPATPVNTVFTVGLTFNEPVSGVADAITVTGGKLDDITGSGKDYVLTIFAKEQTSVTIVLGNTIKDTAPNANAFAGLTLTYKTGDFTAPALVTKAPTLDNKLSDTHPTFTMTFNEDVKYGAGGSLKVYKVGTTTVVLEVPVTAAMINGKNVTVNYTSATATAGLVGLERSTRYYVKVDGSALTDVAGNAFAGVNDAADWTFMTGANWPTPNIAQLSLEFKVYPNPFVDFVMVDNASQLSKVVVSNIAGQIVKEVVNPTDKIQLNELRSGVYFISLYDMDNVIAKTAKIVKR